MGSDANAFAFYLRERHQNVRREKLGEPWDERETSRPTAGNGDHGEEVVFVLRRSPGTSERFDYRMVKLDRATANAVLCKAEEDGFRVVALISDLAVLERH